MDRTEKILGMLTLLELNDDQFCYEMTSLAKKFNNFLDDQSRLTSAQWLSVMYKSLTEENDTETVEIHTNKPVGIDAYETVRRDVNKPGKTDDINVFNESSLRFNDSRFILVDELVAV